MNILLTLIAFILVAILTPIGIIYTLLFKPFSASYYFRQIAISLDQFGNVTCQWLLNATLIKVGGLCFGNEDRTVSYVLGKNKELEKLTVFGKAICKILNQWDTNHVENAVKHEEEIK
jgi:hypothetical protein